jgi:hypothetical protein
MKKSLIGHLKMIKIYGFFFNKAVIVFWKSTVGTLCIIAMFLFTITSGCTEKGEEGEESILGTTWKFIGFVDVQTDVLDEVELIECEKCYTLKFTEETVGGWSILNVVSIIFFDAITISPTNVPFSQRPVVGGTKIGEPSEPTLYTNALKDLTSYIYEDEKLKLFYNEDKNYLLYKLIKS